MSWPGRTDGDSLAAATKDETSLNTRTSWPSSIWRALASRGFSRTLELYGVGYRAIQAADRVTLQLGFSHPVEVQPPEGIRISLESFTPTLENQYLSSRITVEGIDKEQVGQFAAKIRAARKPEPYKGKGVRYAGEVIRRKAGKAGKIGAKK